MQVFLRNTTGAMMSVPCMDGHIYHIMPRSKNSIPDEVDGDLPEGIVRVVVPMPSNHAQNAAPKPMKLEPAPVQTPPPPAPVAPQPHLTVGTGPNN